MICLYLCTVRGLESFCVEEIQERSLFEIEIVADENSFTVAHHDPDSKLVQLVALDGIILLRFARVHEDLPSLVEWSSGLRSITQVGIFIGLHRSLQHSSADERSIVSLVERDELMGKRFDEAVSLWRTYPLESIGHGQSHGYRSIEPSSTTFRVSNERNRALGRRGHSYTFEPIYSSFLH